MMKVRLFTCLFIRHDRLKPLAFMLLQACILSLLCACDDAKESQQNEDMLIEADGMTNDQNMPDSMMSTTIDAEVDLGQVEDMEPVEDMEWTFDLEVSEEAYQEQADAVDRLYAGVAERSLGFPLGIGTVGFFPSPGGFRNPFAASGTDVQHTDLTAKVLLIRNQQKSLVLLRTDTAAMWQDFVVDIQQELRKRGRGDLADGLVLGATHTHASGGKIISHPILRLLAGQFSPALYHRILKQIIDTILEADQAVVPAKVGYKTVQVDSLHEDRRCENGDVIDHSMGLLKVTDDNDKLMGVMVNYSMHGTVIGAEEFLLSNDASGALEIGVEQRLPEYAPVMYFQSWAGDMSPKVPQQHITEEGRETRDDYRDLAAIGKEAADLIIPALETIELATDLPLQVKTLRFPMDNTLVNPDGSFDHYPHGGAYCYPLDHNNCPEDSQEQRVYDASELTCLLSIPEADGITWGQIAAVRLGDLGLVSLPGEPLTSIGTELRDRVAELTGLEQVWVLGYTQGYLGYLLHPYDYLLGGYEGAGGIWGPGLGQFLVDRGVEIMAHLIDSTRPMTFRPVPLPEQADIPFEEVIVEEALGEASWVTAPQRSEEGIYFAQWIGGDPAIDRPYVLLETEVGNEATWMPVTHFSGALWDSNNPELELSLRVDPSYQAQEEQIGRYFYWQVSLPERFSVLPSIGHLSGRFRLVVQGKRPDAYQLVSEVFEITP